MKFQAIGIIKFKDGLELKDPFMEIANVNYDMKKAKFSLICEFYELHSIRVRMFDNPKTITGLVQTQDVVDFISTDSFLSQFELIT